ncbi:INO80 complex subunit D protein [Trifolium repens]|nr:INO80 complex subunit D protein [Trifolium repens]
MNPPNNNPNQNDENSNAHHSETISNESSSRPLSGASHLTRPELLRRRLHNTRRLSRYYRDMYWLLMNQLRFLVRVYTSETGLSPFQEDQEPDGVVADNFNHQCAFAGCEKKPMALTRFCFAHILSDPRQVLYKPCEFVVSSAEGGAEAIRCRKPIDRSTVPSYCVRHMMMMQMADEQVVPLMTSNPHKRKKQD